MKARTILARGARLAWVATSALVLAACSGEADEGDTTGDEQAPATAQQAGVIDRTPPAQHGSVGDLPLGNPVPIRNEPGRTPGVPKKPLQ